jgi:2-oxo-4-hydroxy-4-carboxy-5-ureidoimidazoline decarboxylase
MRNTHHALLKDLNSCSIEDARFILSQCCTSVQWIEGLVAKRPFSSKLQLGITADDIWGTLSEPDFLEAFDGHPKIGDVSSLKEKYAHTKAFASGEQSSVNDAQETVLTQLQVANDEYFKRFGFIFIVCATGKSALEMLELLRQRLPNTRDVEIVNAAEEQRKIFQIRLKNIALVEEQ